MDKIEVALKRLVEGDKRKMFEIFADETDWSPMPWHREAVPAEKPGNR